MDWNSQKIKFMFGINFKFVILKTLKFKSLRLTDLNP